MSPAKKAAFLALLFIALSTPTHAACPSPSKFPGWLARFEKEAASMGISKRAISALDDAAYDASVIKRDRAQNVFSQDFLQFSGRMISNNRLSRGQAIIAKYKPVFAKVEKQYGVPAPVITAFWGLETDFGSNTGNFPTIRALATLAFDCRRPEKFRPQLLAALQIVDRGDLQPSDLIGAWAGEIGQMQFLPKDYIESGVDFDGDGRVDLRNSIPDVVASSASLLVKHGWHANQPWLQEVRVPDDLPWQEADIAVRHPRSQWAKWGVTYASGKALKADKVQVSLLLPMGRNGPAFLAYPNFTEVYLKWNESLVYSTTAAYFATRLAGAPPVSRGRGPVEVLSYKQILDLQKLLSKRGYDVGDIDGKLGAKSRAAVKDVQIKFGMPADSWPTPDLLERLRQS